MIDKKLVLILPLVLLTSATSIGINQVKAWDGGGAPDNGPGLCGGFCAGEQDAVYDLQNSLAYQPYGSCLPCHSQGYWDNFREGYNSYWNSHQQQESNQGSSINIYGNNNYVSTEQFSNQQQNPLRQLAHTVCGWVNCNQPQGGP